MRVERADPDDPGARDAADPAVRHRRAASSASCRAARRGEWSPAFALSEPDAGSDPGGMITTPVRDGDEWVINGTKNWITNLGVADFYVVFARTDREAGPLARDLARSSSRPTGRASRVGKLEHKLGIKGSPTGQPIFDDVRVPAENLIGEESRGFKVAIGDPRPLAPRRRRAGGRASPRARPTTPPPTPRSASSSASRSRASRGSSSSSPTWRRSTAAARELLYRACAKIDAGERRHGQVLGDGEAVRVRHRDGGDRPRRSRCSAATATSTSTRSSG